MKADYCPIANEPCQSMCLGDCCLKKGVKQAKLEAEIRRLSEIESAARNLVKVKGHHHTEQAYKALEALIKGSP